MKTPNSLINYCLSILGLLLIISCQQNVNMVHPEVMTLTEAVYASGVLVPESEYLVFANTDGFLTQQFVQEGDTVQQGELMFLVNNTVRKQQEEILYSILQETKLKNDTNGPAFLELASRKKILKDQISNDSTTLERLTRLLKENAIALSEWETAQLRLESRKNELRSLEMQENNLKRVSTLEIRQAENQYETVLNQNKEGQVRAFNEGIVVELFKQTGEKVSPNEPLALIGEKARWIARLSVDERDLKQVKTGQQVFISIDALGKEEFNATVHRIYPKLNRAEQSFLVDAYFETPLDRQLYGMNLEANIIIRTKDEVLTLPRAVLTQGDSLTVIRDDKEMKIAIETGISDLERIEIVNGLKSTDQVILNKKQ